MTAPMTIPYYSDGSDGLVTLYHGDCREVLPTVNPGSVDVLLADPPYFQVKDDDWDRQWRKQDDFLMWLGGILDLAKPLLAPSASVWVFASPFMARAVEDAVGDRFRVLNSIRWVKERGWHQKAETEAQRRYLTPWEAVIFAEQFGAAYDEQAKAVHREVFAPIGQYIAQERERAGMTRNSVEVALGYTRATSTRGTGLCSLWEEGSSFPSVGAYEKLRGLLGAGFLVREYEELRREYEELRRPYEDLRREHEDLRRPFRLTERGPVTDLWTFPPVMGYPGKHPCEKPGSMLRHILTTSARLGGVVLDPFAGSCSTLRVCKELGLRGIGIESDERYCDHAAQRLSQEIMIVPDGATGDQNRLVDVQSVSSHVQGLLDFEDSEVAS